MLKDSAVRQEIQKHTNRNIPQNIVFMIIQKLTRDNQKFIEKVISDTEKVQEIRNRGRTPPLKRLSYKIVQEVLNDNF